MSDGIVLCKNEVTSLLEARWNCMYMMGDDSYRHAGRCFDSRERLRIDEIEKRFGNRMPSDDEVVATYNRILAEEIEDYIRKNCEILALSRAEMEVEIAETMLELYDVFGNGRKAKGQS